MLARPHALLRFRIPTCYFRAPSLPRRARRKFSSPPAMQLAPRKFPSAGFEAIAPSEKVEEERLPFYNRHDYYPMCIGQVIDDRYQVVAKLGYGTSSTVWLAHDLSTGKYWALKVHVNTLTQNQELKVYQHLATVELEEEHPGQQHVRQVENSFKLKGPHGDHEVFVMAALGMSVRTLQELQKDMVFQQNFVLRALDQVLLGLGYLHGADIVHTDIHSDNLLIAITDDSILSKVEQDEISKPSARKRINDTIIYVSRYMLGGAGPLVISDLGQARIGPEHYGNAMPLQYRAPEVILNMPWGKSVDAWGVGLLAWDLLERESLFSVYDHESQELNDAHHLAAMTAVLGPPPREFLSKSPETTKYWSAEGQWHGPVPLPPTRDFQTLATRLEGGDKEMFLSFIDCFLSWLPEDRLNTMQAFFHPWLRGTSGPTA